jgi:choline monooxygenase
MEAILAKDFEVHQEVRRAETLPARAFTDPEFLDLELRTLFERTWQLIPPRPAADLRADPRSLPDLVRRRGARAPVSVLDRPLFLQRDWQGTLRAFPNVCTHAWHTLVQGPERERSIVCPQHGRRFDTEGRFVSQPGFEGAPGFPRDCDHLRGLPAETWGDLVFTSLGQPQEGLAKLLEPVRASLRKLAFEDLRRQPLDSEVRELPGNWKQHAWNYMDQMHIPFVHAKPGGLSEAVELASYRTEPLGGAALQWAYAKDPRDGFEPALLPARFADPKRRVFALWWFVFPNLTLNFYPWGLSVNLYAPVPGEPQRTRFHWYHYAWDEALYAQREDRWMLGAVDDEDVDALTQVSRGARSGFAERGRFAPKGEEGPHWFHRAVYASVFGGGEGSRKPRARKSR